MSWRWLLLLLTSAAGCAEPVVAPAAPSAPSARRIGPLICTSKGQPIAYTTVSPLGVSAADVVARFGGKREVARLDLVARDSVGVLSDRQPPRLSVSFSYTGGPVEYRVCFDRGALGFGVRLTLEHEGGKEEHDAWLSSGGPNTATIANMGRFLGTPSKIYIQINGPDTDVSLSAVRPPLWSLQWSSLCGIAAEPLLTDLFGPIPGPLLAGQPRPALTCFPDTEGGKPTSLGPPEFWLTRVARTGCREYGSEQVVNFQAVVGTKGSEWMPTAAQGWISVDTARGLAELQFSDRHLPPSPLLQGLEFCQRPPHDAALSYRLQLTRTESAVEVTAEQLRFGLHCRDSAVDCASGTMKDR